MDFNPFSIRFELGLGKQFGGGFMVAAEIDLTLFAQRMHFGFEFDLQHPARSILSAKDSGMYKYKKGLKQPRKSVMYNAYDPPNPFTDFDLTGKINLSINLLLNCSLWITLVLINRLLIAISFIPNLNLCLLDSFYI